MFYCRSHSVQATSKLAKLIVGEGRFLTIVNPQGHGTLHAYCHQDRTHNSIGNHIVLVDISSTTTISPLSHWWPITTMKVYCPKVDVITSKSLMTNLLQPHYHFFSCFIYLLCNMNNKHTQQSFVDYWMQHFRSNEYINSFVW